MVEVSQCTYGACSDSVFLPFYRQVSVPFVWCSILCPVLCPLRCLPLLFFCGRRLYCKGIVLGYKRSLRNQYVDQVRIKVQGLDDKKDVDFYLGKRVAYIYKAKTVKKATPTTEGRYRVIWGRVIGSHGNNGSVRAKFRKNLPPTSIGGPVRVMLYPSRV